MASTPRQQIASPQSFTSDPLEQTFAKQFSDPNSVVGALSLVNMQTAGAARERGQAQYLDNLHQTNALAAALAKQDMQADLDKTALEHGFQYIGQGVDPATMPTTVGRLFTPGTALSGADQMPALKRALIQAEINQKNAAAAAHGQEGAPKTSLEVTYDANGAPVIVTKVEGKVTDISKITDTSSKLGTTLRQGMGNPNFPADPNAPYKSRTVGDVSAAVGENFQQRHNRPMPTTPPFAASR